MRVGNIIRFGACHGYWLFNPASVEGANPNFKAEDARALAFLSIVNSHRIVLG